MTRLGEVRDEVCEEACLIFRFVSLSPTGREGITAEEVGDNTPIEVGRLNVTQTFRLTGANHNQVCRYEVVTFAAYDIPNLHVFPFLFDKGGFLSKDFGLA